MTNSQSLSGRRFWFAVAILGALPLPAKSALEAAKGFRAVAFTGGALREPIRVIDAESATALYVSLLRGTSIPSDSVRLLSPRSCIQVSFFMLRPQNESLRVEHLLPHNADFVYRLYLYEPGVPPVLALNESIARRVNLSAIEELAALKVPTSIAGSVSETCTG